MAISLSWARPKLADTVTTASSLIPKTLTEGSTYYEFPLCFDNLVSTPVALTGISFSSGSPTITGTALELANVKIGSTFVTAGDTADFASGTYVTAKPTPTTLTVSTNSLQSGSATTATATLTVDATVAIIRINVSTSGAELLLTPVVAAMSGSNATDPNGNGYDEVTYSNASKVSTASAVRINLDTFLSNFGKARANS
jgi:hypothetical protein